MKLEMKSISNCLNFSDTMILYEKGKHIGIGNLEDVRDYLIETSDNAYVEDIVLLHGVLNQINLILENFYDEEYDGDLTKEYWILRKHLLAWLAEKNTKPESDVDKKQ